VSRSDIARTPDEGTHSMPKPRASTPYRRAAVLALLLAAPLPFSMQGCTDLTETPQSQITPDQFYHTDAEVLGGLASVYAKLRATLDAYYDLSEISTDEVVVPTRGQDWFDNGKWIELHQQTWGANSALGLDDVNSAYDNLSIGIARANVVLNAIDKSAIANKPAIVAELRVLRAFYYYQLMDLFGGMPIVTTTEIATRPRATRAETFAFIEKELKESRADLPATRPASEYGRVTQGAVDAMLAELYLNAEVFTGTVTTAGLTKGPARWQDAIDAANAVLNSGHYSLESGANWRKNFTPDNYNSTENIFSVNLMAAPGLGLNFPMRVLHYNQYDSPTPWNGFSTLAETYRAFDNTDVRKAIFLEGPQVNQVTGLPATDRAGNPLIFTDTVGNIHQANENEGARIMKWPVDPAHVAENNGNDFAWFRLSEMILIKAEALNELGQTAAAITLINSVHDRSDPTPLNIAANQQAVRDAILKERLLEFTGEGKRRMDMIRMGVFLKPFGLKGDQSSEPYRILFPIPATQIQTNPLLEQNPGY
jgi:starch-binding outer membrane protein, SusD/RagB family